MLCGKTKVLLGTVMSLDKARQKVLVANQNMMQMQQCQNGQE